LKRKSLKEKIMKLSEAAELYIKLRDEKAALKTEYDAKKAPIEAKMEKLELLILGVFDKAGINSVTTPFGTPYVSTKSTASIADKEVFWTHVRSNELWELLEVRASKAGVDVYVKEKGDVPPGVNLRTERTINVRRSS